MSSAETRNASLNALKNNGSLSRLHKVVVRYLVRVSKQKLKTDASLREISKGTGMEMCTVSARINELKARGVAVESDKRKCKVTGGRRITPVRLSEDFLTERARA